MNGYFNENNYISMSGVFNISFSNSSQNFLDPYSSIGENLYFYSSNFDIKFFRNGYFKKTLDEVDKSSLNLDENKADDFTKPDEQKEKKDHSFTDIQEYESTVGMSTREKGVKARREKKSKYCEAGSFKKKVLYFIKESIKNGDKTRKNLTKKFGNSGSIYENLCYFNGGNGDIEKRCKYIDILLAYYFIGKMKEKEKKDQSTDASKISGNVLENLYVHLKLLSNSEYIELAKNKVKKII